MVLLVTVVVMVLIFVVVFVVVFGDGTRIFGWLLRLFMRCVLGEGACGVWCFFPGCFSKVVGCGVGF